MEHFPHGIHFKYLWRGYQKRVLADLEQYISNGALHVVAPPGSGKTVLGLEVMLRLDTPTLILAPTIAVRNQWVDRFCELFLQTVQVPDWISCDIRQPSFLTVSTYQALHAACDSTRRKEKQEDVIQLLQQQGVKTVVVDEAHHLKNEWWHALRKLQDALSPIIVGLTATPPYDVTPAEWDRYIALNGPVDAEITVPELMREGDLCPHQDYIYFSRPSQWEYERICDFRKRADSLFQELLTDKELLHAIESLPLWEMPDESLEWIYDHMAYYSSMLIYMHATGQVIPLVHLEIVGNEHTDFPAFDYNWAETLLDLYLNKERTMFIGCEVHQERLENRLLRYGVIECGQISFQYNRKINSALTTSVEKVNSISDIVRFEYQHLKKDLRLVVLADFIRKEFLTAGPNADLYTGKLGVLPIFEKLRRENLPNLRLGVLTGSIVIIPREAMSVMQEKFLESRTGELQFSVLPYDDRYVRMTLTDSIRGAAVKYVTDLFQAGAFEVLVGTKSLLGEGWDAPALNALILASSVGSFVLSNQMRGRAIRTMRGNENKTGNIWHLVCADLSSPTGGGDVEMLRRRFKGFVGVSFLEDGCIENGIHRLDLPDNFLDWDVLKQFNEKTLSLAADRAGLRERWRVGLERGVSLIEEIKMPIKAEYREKVEHVKMLYLTRTIACLVAGLCSGLTAFGMDFLQVLFKSRPRAIEDFKWLLLIFGILGVIYFGRETIKVFRLYLHYRDITKDIRGIGEALLQSLIRMGNIRTSPAKLTVSVQEDGSGGMFCHLRGGTNFEKSMFTEAMSEIVSVIDSPRYLILRKSRKLFFISQTDYHAVPEVLGRKKESSAYFAECWRKLVGENELIFTRSKEGRKMLLKARMEALSAYFAEDVERVSKWK